MNPNTDLDIPKEVYRVEPTFTPARTIPRSTDLDLLDPFEAALAVGEFLGAPQQHGPWHLDRFEIDDEGMVMDYIRAHGDGMGRWAVSVGTFVKLWKEEPGAGLEGGAGRALWMSNTGQEVLDHAHAFEHAEGNVLVHGLGLSCVVSGLLAKPEVDHIDVVEINPDVIAMVGPAYANEPRVTIHEGDCLTYPWPEGARWNYVWHDIWETIGPRNLDPDTAENGISYGLLHDRFKERCEMQGFWARDLALKMRGIEREEEVVRQEFEEKWKTASEEERCDMLIDFQFNAQLKVPGIIGGHSREQTIQVMEFMDGLEGLFLTAADDTPPRLLG